MTQFKYKIGILLLTALAANIWTLVHGRGEITEILKDCVPNKRCIVKIIRIDNSVPVTSSCLDRCDQSEYDFSQRCQCDLQCAGQGDCCADYGTSCGGSSITNEELLLIGQSIWNSDTDRLAVDIDLTNATTQNDTAKLFTTIPDGVTTKPMYVTFTTLFQNYNRNQSVSENFNDTQWKQVDDFLTEVTKSQSMVVLNKFLAAKGNASSDSATFQSSLRDIWFSTYARSSTGSANSTSGFEHVMVGEVDDSLAVKGFHNWVRFALLEQTGNVTYLGYFNSVNFTDNVFAISSRFDWDDFHKDHGSFFIGTSPAFDMALFTLCYYARPNVQCNLTINAEKLQIVTHTSSCQLAGDSCVGTAYPQL